MDELKISTRSEIPESDKWDLTGLFADVGKWQEAFIWVQTTHPRLKEWKGKLGASLLSTLGWVGYKIASEVGELTQAFLQKNPLAFWGPLLRTGLSGGRPILVA